MPAPPISRRRERRFLALVEAGATVSEASRAVEISRQTVYRRARADSVFAHRLDAARVRTPGPPVEDWRDAALILEGTDPLRWALPGGPGDPFDPLSSY